MRTVMRCFGGAFVALLATAAYAAQLGDPQGSMVAGAPIDASIQVLADPRAASATVTLSHVAIVDADGVARSFADELRSTVEHDHSGTYIRVTSPGPVVASKLRFRVRYGTKDLAWTRNYEVTLARPRPLPTARAATRTRQASPRSAAVAGEGRYGPVRAGESLWRIARDLSSVHGGSIHDLMARLLADNPDAFIAGDMNRLRVGATLTLAGATATFSNGPVAVPAPRAPEPTKPAPRPDSALAAMGVARDPEVAKVPATLVQEPVRQPIAGHTQNREHDAEIRRLDEKFARIRARYGAASSTAPRPAPRAVDRPTQIAAQVEEPTVAPSPLAEAIATPVAVVTNDAGPIAKPKAEAAPDEGVFAALQIVAAMSVGALILGALSYRLTRRTVQVNRMAEQRQLESARKEHVAQKAAQRLELEAEVKRILTDQQRSRAAVEPQGPNRDNLNEVDRSMTQGRYQRAELLLKEVLRESPRNVDAKLRLADVFYVTERADAFLRVAQDLRSHHRAEINDDDWQKVVRMGRVLCPDESLFGNLNDVSRERRTA